MLTEIAVPVGPQIAEHIDMNVRTGVLSIDGAPIGCAIVDEPVSVSVLPNEPYRLTVTLWADHVTFSGTLDNEDIHGA